MRSNLFFVLFITLTTTGIAWKPGYEYRYDLQTRSLTSLYQVTNEYVGILTKAKLTILPKTESYISLKIHDSRFAEIHKLLNDGWATYIPDHQLDYYQLPISNKPFEVKLKDGMVDKLIIDKSLPTWQVNIIKSIVSQLQLDMKGVNLKKSRTNEGPDLKKPLAVYKTVEDSVTGKCVTQYDVAPLPYFILMMRPHLAPQFHLSERGQIIEIIKTQNYSQCQQRIVYNSGNTGTTNWVPGSNYMGKFMTRSNIGRTIISGNLQDYIIQSSVATNKIILSPHIYNNQKGIVVSSLNLTLEHRANTTETPQPISNPYFTTSLVYEYNPAHNEQSSNFAANEKYRHKRGMKFDIKTNSSKNISGNSSGEASKLMDEENSSSSSSSVSEMNTRVNIFDPYLQNKKSSKFLWLGGTSNNSSDPVHKLESELFESVSSSFSSTSIDSNEGIWQRKPQLNMPAKIPFFPYFIGYEGYSIQSFKQIDSTSVLITLAHQIADEIQNPNEITGKNTLTKFNIMIRFIRTLNTKQLTELSSILYFNSSISENENEKKNGVDNWIIFRDAVALSGTGPALVTIKQWIQNGQIKEYEAAQIVAVLPHASFYPTEEYMNAFFALISSNEVKSQKFLNATAVLAFTDLVYKTRISNQTARNQFPVFSFGHMVSKNNQDMKNVYLPYLIKELKRSIKAQDSSQILLYIKSLCNTGHSQIIEMLKPYIEGREYLTKFQHLFVILSMDRVTITYPKMVQSMLYKLYQNTGNPHEIRTAAVIQLMKTNPSEQILQRMAEYTNYDTSKHVNSVIKSLIESTANLNTHDNQPLRQKAQAAINMLNQDIYGMQYSKSYIQDYVEENQYLGYEYDFAYIQSKGSIIPKSILFNLRRHMGSLKLGNRQMSAMLSSFDELLKSVTNQFSTQNTVKVDVEQDSKIPSEEIIRMLNIEPDTTEKLEGNFYFPFFGGIDFFTFDNASIEAIFNNIKEDLSKLNDGEDFKYTKFENKFSMSIGFPTVSGLPFIYSMDIPTYTKLTGDIKLETEPNVTKDNFRIPDSFNIDLTFNLVYSLKTQSKMGIISPFNHHHYVTGFDKNTHIAVPIRIINDVDVKNNKYIVKVEALSLKEKQKIFEYSTTMYTAKHDIFDIVPPLSQHGGKQFQSKLMKKYETTLGKNNIGFAFDLEVESEMDIESFTKNFHHDELITSWLYPYAEKLINNNNVTITFNPTASSNRAATFTLNFGTQNGRKLLVPEAFNKKVHKQPSRRRPKSKLKQEDSNTKGSNLNTKDSSSLVCKLQESEQRKNEFLNNAGNGIRNSTSFAFDASVEFTGENPSQYVITWGYAKNIISNMSRILLSFCTPPETSTSGNENNQVAIDVSIKKSQFPLMNYKEALVINPKIDINGKINFGPEKIHEIKFMGNLTRSSQRIKYIELSTTARLCKEQMQSGNYLLQPCQKSISEASILDHVKITWAYNKIPHYWNNLVNNIYQRMKHYGYDFYSEDLDTITPLGEMDTIIAYENDLKAINISIKTPSTTINFNKISVKPWLKAGISFNPIHNPIYQIFDEIMNEQSYSSCGLDEYSATTFDSKEYPINLGNCWHIMIQNIPSSQTLKNHSWILNKSDNFGILVRENGFKQREIKMFLGDNVIEIFPMNFGMNETSAKIKLNDEEILIPYDAMVQYNDNNGDVVFEGFISPEKVIVINSLKYGAILSYDGTRILSKVTNKYRGKLAGLCGTFDGEPSTDFTTQQKCILKDPIHFATHFRIVKEGCSAPSKEYQHEIQQAPCLKTFTSFGHINEGNEEIQPDSNKTPDKSAECKKQQVLTLQEDDQICFSIKPYSICEVGCIVIESTTKNVEFHCLGDSIVTRHWLEMIKNGANPDFSQKGVSKNSEIKIAEVCSKK